MSLPNATTDRNLLFGILALQMDFINRDALIKAMHAWALEKAKTLGQILVQQGALRADRFALLEALVLEHIRQHGNDPRQSLVALTLPGPLHETLEQIADPDLQASLTHVSATRSVGADTYAAQASAAGTPTSTGLRFRVLRPHARGGLGEVFVAADEELRREVALKQIQERFADDPTSQARFVLEAEVTGGLEHPGIVPVYGLGRYPDGRPFYAMRFIKGDSLKDAIERFHQADRTSRDPGERALALRELLSRFIAACNAIAYAHSRGVIHRDLKPANIMLGPYGETLVVDWGLAKPLSGPDVVAGTEETTLRPAAATGSAPTQMGSAVGTPAFMSPEQAAGRLDLLGPASDVYSLGATLYALLTGKAPFDKTDVGTVLRRVQGGDFPPPRQVNRSVPSALEAVCLRAMALRPEARYPSARALADDLEHWLADEPVSAYREPLGQRLRRWGRRHRGVVLALAATLVLVTGVSLGAALLINRARQEAQDQRDRQVVARRQAVQARQQEARQRRRAVLARQKEKKHRLRAQAAQRGEAVARSRAEQALVRQYVGQAVRLMDKDDLLGSLPWLTAALRWEHDDPARATMQRVRFAALLRQCPHLEQVWLHLGTVYDAEFSPDGRRVVTASAASWGVGAVQVWDTVTGEPVTPLLKHQRAVWQAAFSPNGRRVVGAGPGGTRVWTVATAAGVAPAFRERGAQQAWFSPNSRHVLTAYNDNTARVWDAVTGKAVTPFLKHAQKITQAAFSPDGRHVLTASADRTARIWDAVTGEPAGEPLQHGQAVTYAVFSPDSRRVATVAADRTVRVWDATTSKALTGPLEHPGAVWLAWFSPDSRQLLTAGAPEGGGREVSLQRWDVATGQRIYPNWGGGNAGKLQQASLSPDGQRLLTIHSLERGLKTEVRVWDVASGQPLTPPLKTSVPIRKAVFSPDGRLLVTSSGDWRQRRSTVQTWESDSGKPAGKAIEYATLVERVSFSPAGRRLLVVASGERLTGEVRVWDVRAGSPVTPVWKPGGRVSKALFAPSGRTVLTVSQGIGQGQATQVTTWDVATGRPARAPHSYDGRVADARFSPDGRRLAIAGVRWEGERKAVQPIRRGRALQPGAAPVEQGPRAGDFVAEVYVCHADTGALAAPVLKLGISVVQRLAFSPDGRRLLVTGDRYARVWDVAAGKPVTPPLEHGGEVAQALYSPDGRRVFTAGLDRTARVWDAATGEPLTPSVKQRFAVQQAVFGRDGNRLLVAGWAEVHLDKEAAPAFEVDEPERQPPTERKEVRQLWHGTVSADGRRVVIGNGKAVRVWDAETGQPVTPLLKHGGPIAKGSFSPDGRRLVTAGWDRTTRVWDLATTFADSSPLEQQRALSSVRFTSYLRQVRGLVGELEVRFWDLTPSKVDRADLPSLAELLAAHTTDETGGQVSLEAARVAALWKTLRVKYPQLFTTTARQVEAWHRQEAYDCEVAGNWRAAVTHLDRLLQAHPTRWELLARRGRAHAEQGHWSRAASDYARAQQLAPDQTLAWLHREVADAREDRVWPTARWYLDQLIKARPGEALLRRQRGAVHAELGRWQEAGADFKKAIELGDQDETVFRQQALACLADGDRAGYRAACARLLKQLGDTASHERVNRVAWTCLLQLGTVADPEPLVRRAAEACAALPKGPAYAGTHAAALYRTGQFKAAAGRLNEALTLTRENVLADLVNKAKPVPPRGFRPPPQQVRSVSGAFNTLFLAMTCQRLGKPAEADRCLRGAALWLDQVLGTQGGKRQPTWWGPPLSWEERVGLQALRREAQALVKGGKK